MRLIDFCITQLKAQGPSRPCKDSQAEERREEYLHPDKEFSFVGRCVVTSLLGQISCVVSCVVIYVATCVVMCVVIYVATCVVMCVVILMMDREVGRRSMTRSQRFDRRVLTLRF